MECYHCKGRMVKGNAPFSVDRQGYYLGWDSIPAWVCTQLLEFSFGERTATVEFANTDS